jgi:acetyltransferase-like isoleucine patch superfamily enzyme
MLWYKNILKECGSGCCISSPLYYTPDCIILKNNVYIYKNCRIEGVKQYSNKKYQPIIIINNNVSIQQNLHLTCATKIEIGSNTAIAVNVTITDIHHTYSDISKPIEAQIIQTNPVIIGEDCKIYNNVVILPGTTIGKHCTVGANSVVRGIFPNYSVIIGSPARIIKRYSFEQNAWLKTDAAGNFIQQKQT